MIRLFQTAILAGAAVGFAACSDAAPTAPKTAAASRDAVGFSAPSPRASCSVTQLGTTQYEVTVAWSALSAVGVRIFNGTTLLAQTQFTHPIRSGSLTDTLSTAPDIAEVDGQKIGARVPCS